MKIFVSSLLALASIMTMIAANPIKCSGPNARIEPPVGAIVVDPTGDPKYQGSFRNMIDAVAGLDRTLEEDQTIFVFSGVYEGRVVIPPIKGKLVLQGATCDATSYAKNQATITHKMSQKNSPKTVTSDHDAETSAMHFKANNVKVYNLNIANTAGNAGQAVAATVDGTNYGFYGCKFTGYQDTLLTKKGLIMFANSYISGAVDFIFGTEAVAWFEHCDIDCIDAGYITANGRSSADMDSYYVFNHANIYSSKKGYKPGMSYLGRPWRPYARVVFQNSELSDVVNAAGWSDWNGDSTEHVEFGEFKNTGPGAAKGNGRPGLGTQLKAAVALKDFFKVDLKSQWWIDSAYVHV
uniref:Pectinesterase n=1 Tax=Peronospora matthiolae TaxID=2874970 RepID=A0AAV1TAU1_9STRA